MEKIKISKTLKIKKNIWEFSHSTGQPNHVQTTSEKLNRQNYRKSYINFEATELEKKFLSIIEKLTKG